MKTSEEYVQAVWKEGIKDLILLVLLDTTKTQYRLAKILYGSDTGDPYIRCRLQELEKKGLVTSDKISGRGRYGYRIVYSRTDKGVSYIEDIKKQLLEFLGHV